MNCFFFEIFRASSRQKPAVIRGAELCGWPRSLTYVVFLVWIFHFRVQVVRAWLATGDGQRRYSGHPCRRLGLLVSSARESSDLVLVKY